MMEGATELRNSVVTAVTLLSPRKFKGVELLVTYPLYFFFKVMSYLLYVVERSC